VERPAGEAAGERPAGEAAGDAVEAEGEGQGEGPSRGEGSSDTSQVGAVVEERQMLMMQYASEIAGALEGEGEGEGEARGTAGVDEVCKARAGWTGPPREPAPAVSVRQRPAAGGAAEAMLRAAEAEAAAGGGEGPESPPDSDAGSPSAVARLASSPGTRAAAEDRGALLAAPPALPAPSFGPPLAPDIPARVRAVDAEVGAGGAPGAGAPPGGEAPLFPRIRALDVSEVYSDASGDEVDGEADSDASRLTLRHPVAAAPAPGPAGATPGKVDVREEEEDDDEGMVIAMKYLGRTAFREALVDTGDEELLSYLRGRGLL